MDTAETEQANASNKKNTLLGGFWQRKGCGRITHEMVLIHVATGKSESTDKCAWGKFGVKATSGFPKNESPEYFWLALETAVFGQKMALF